MTSSWLYPLKGKSLRESRGGSTYVVITESGWTGDGDELVRYVAESTQGFIWTLAGLKAFLEHGIRLNLVADKNPDAHQVGWQPG